jgi:hypothetical protein
MRAERPGLHSRVLQMEYICPPSLKFPDMKQFITASCLILLAACHPVTAPSDHMITVDSRSRGPVDIVHSHMDSLLETYYQLKNDMVIYDTTRADSVASALAAASSRIPVAQMKDSSKSELAKTTVTSLQAEIAGFTGENTMEGKREEFQMISDITYDLIKTIGLRYQTVYREFCPMAFDNKGAYWLSNQEKIENPYLGKKMLDCGEVRETMKY